MRNEGFVFWPFNLLRETLGSRQPGDRAAPEAPLRRHRRLRRRSRSPLRPDPETGWLLVLKSSLAGDELARIENYQQENPEFPQQSTADQFFDDDQFESYRELGYHVAKSSLLKASDTARQPELGKDWEACWEALVP